MRAPNLGAALAAATSRLMDELPVVILGVIAVMLIAHAKDQGLAGLVHDGVLGIITGFFGYMRGRSSRPPSAAAGDPVPELVAPRPARPVAPPADAAAPTPPPAKDD